ncbi:MAG: hypothetical protein HZB61_03730 [Nitrospirae bacterium]|nr:hypothetical protein [Nitrospirota bacterium]
MAKTRKIKFELLVVTKNDTKGNSGKSPSVWRNLMFTEARELIQMALTVTAIIIVYALIVYSDNMIKRILTWFINLIKDI